MELVTEDTPSMRAADNDRTRVVQQLTEAHAEGRLDLAEFDERVAQVWAARTYAELAHLTADLPGRQAPRPYVPVPVESEYQLERQENSKAARFFFRLWVVASLVNFTVWGIVSLSLLEFIYPWWIWVVGPWGAVILAARITRFGLPR
jgi:hypothetical protein